MVRGGIEPPTPRFSGAPNGSNLASAGESGVRGVPHAAPCCHDLSRMGGAVGAEGATADDGEATACSPSPCHRSARMNCVRLLHDYLKIGRREMWLKPGEMVTLR